MRGPIDFIIVGFSKNKFDSSILKELTKAVDKGIIKVLDIALVQKNTDGSITSVELSDMQDNIISSLSISEEGIITEDDVAEVGDILEPGASAGLLIVEQLWALGLKSAILKAGGELISEGRIHPEASVELDKKGAK